MIVKAWDDKFWDYNFDIFNDHGPINTTAYLIVNSTKLMKYIMPIAFIEHRYTENLANGTVGLKNEYLATAFKECKMHPNVDKELDIVNQIEKDLTGRLCPDWELNDLQKKVLLAGSYSN